MGKFKFKLKEAEPGDEIVFIEPRPEAERGVDDEPGGKIIYVDDERVPKELLLKIQNKYGPIPKGSYFTDNFSMYWEKYEPDYGGEVNTGTRLVTKQYRLPNINNVFKSFVKLNNEIEWLEKNEDIKKDERLTEILQQIRKAFNAYRTHIRKEYPELYKGLKNISEDEIEEISTTGGGEYATPNAFRKNKKAKGTDDDILTKKFGYKLAENKKEEEKDTKDTETKDSKDKDALSKEDLKKIEKLKKDRKKIDKLLKKDPKDWNDTEKKELKSFKDTYKSAKSYEKLGQFWENLNKDIGAILGPGPKAGPDGVKDNYYVSNFQYKLVPKKIKGSGIYDGGSVKQLWEDEDNNSKKNFQKTRIDAFNSIEKDLNHIYKAISNAKNETIKHYKNNPNSYKVLKPTDLISDYLKDIKNLIGQE